MNANRRHGIGACSGSARSEAPFLLSAVLGGLLLVGSTLAFAEQPRTGPGAQLNQADSVPAKGGEDATKSPGTGQMSPMSTNSNSMAGMDTGAKPADSKDLSPMPMGSMQGGRPPVGARDPNAYSDGYAYTSMPGLEKADQLPVAELFVEQLEYTHSDEGEGIAWDAQAWYGPDENKLWLRSEGGVVQGSVDFTTSAEALWWRALTPFWGTALGVHQDFGPGALTDLAVGIEGLTPYWFEFQATGYVDYEGRVWARLKGSYDIRLTQRLILTPEVESSLYSRANARRGIGSGLANIELSLRLRYEFSRKFAPYIGFDWDRALGASVSRREAVNQPASGTMFVAGVRVWF